MRRSPSTAVAALLGLLAACGGGSDGRGDDAGDGFGAGLGSGPCQVAFPAQASSPYVLPYAVGMSYVVGQGNCTDGSHSEDQQYAYDFDMPIGTTVVAARAGSVIQVEDRFAENNDTPGEENFIVIEHADGTVAGYYHLTQGGAAVALDATVAQGEAIGRSGNTGDSSEPHLHFEVLDQPGGDTLPVTFRNTRAHPEGLVEGESYEAGAS